MLNRKFIFNDIDIIIMNHNNYDKLNVLHLHS